MQFTWVWKHSCSQGMHSLEYWESRRQNGMDFLTQFSEGHFFLTDTPRKSWENKALQITVRWPCIEAVGPVKTALDEWIIWGILCKSDRFLNGHHMGAGRWLAKVSVLLLLDRLPSSMLSMKGTDTKWFPKPLSRLCADRGLSCLSRRQVLGWTEPRARPQLCCQPLSALMHRDNCLPGVC